MTAPAPTKWCKQCNSSLTYRRITTGVPGTRPVDLGLCNCDYLPCPSCKKPVRDPKSRRCPHCNGQV